MSPEAWACHLDSSVSLRWSSGVVPHRFKYRRARQFVLWDQAALDPMCSSRFPSVTEPSFDIANV